MSGTAAPGASPANASGGLADIVVTANKREERLQDVPIAIQAVTGAQLAMNHISTTQDLQLLSPSLVYNQLGGFAQPFLRGIGTDVSSPNVDPSVATYIDGAFLADSQSTITNLLGVERVEVVSGPQGTLYGRNAVGGAINIITLTPQQKFDSRASVGIGNLDSLDASYRISGGVTDTLAVGLYAAGSRRDSIYGRFGPIPKNDYPPYSHTGDREHQSNYGVRLKANWTPSSAVRLVGSVEYLRTQSPDASAFRQGQDNATGFAMGAPVQTGYRVLQTDYPDENHFNQFTATLREEVNLGDYQIVGISSYHRTKGFTSNDLDATSTPLYASFADITNKHFSQEAQLLSPKDRPIAFILGAYYFHQNSFEGITNQSEIAFPAPITSILLDDRVKTQSAAVFGEVTWKPFYGFRITAGGRYTHETKKERGAFTSSLDDTGAQVGPVTNFPNANLRYSNFTPKVTIDYKVGGAMFYATYSKGFKSGAFNMASPSDPPVTPEKLTSYEGGVKSTLVGGKLRLNLDGYYYDFKDLQVQSLKQGTGGLSVYKNAANARAYGIEASVAVAVTHELRLTGQAAWEHTEYKDFQNYPGYIVGVPGDPTAPGNTGINVDALGNQLQRAPKWVGTFAADYNKQLASGGKVSANANVYYNGGYYWDPTNTIRQKRYALLNGSVGYTLPDGHWSVNAYASNLTNKHYQTVEYRIVFGTLVTDAMPRTYGLSVAYQF